MSYFTQMAGLAYHNFASAAVGIALAIAIIRGIARKESKTIGNFWVDITRGMLWVLLPACLVIALVFVSQGMIQNLQALRHSQAPEPANRADHRRRRQDHLANRHRPGDRCRAPSLRRKPSRFSAPMAAASSTPIAPIRLRIPLRSPISCRS